MAEAIKASPSKKAFGFEEEHELLGKRGPLPQTRELFDDLDYQESTAFKLTFNLDLIAPQF